MDLYQSLATIRRWWWLVMLSTVLAGAGAFVASGTMPRTYQATTTLTVNRHGAGFDNLALSTRLAGTYIELLHKRPLLETVIANLQLTTTPESLAQRSRAVLRGDTLLIVLTVKDSDPERAAAIANEMVRTLGLLGPSLLGGDPITARSNLTVIEVAQPPALPISPRPLQNVVLTMILAGLAASGGVMLREYFDARVRSLATLQRLSGAAPLAAIGPLRGARPSDRLISAASARSPAADAYRLLQARIETAADPVRTIAVTSSSPREGRSATAANLAIALAQSGKRVILVDADLRRPVLHTLFHQTNAHGFTTAVQQPAASPPQRYLARTGVENLRLLPSGPLPQRPPDLLGAPGVADLIAQLKADADVVVFDTPPTLGVADSLLLARACDMTLLVARVNLTRTDALRRALDMFAQFGLHPPGVVLNAAPAPHARWLDAFYRQHSPRGGETPAVPPVAQSATDPGAASRQ